jgi:hypothetical protein
MGVTIMEACKAVETTGGGATPVTGSVEEK